MRHEHSPAAVPAASELVHRLTVSVWLVPGIICSRELELEAAWGALLSPIGYPVVEHFEVAFPEVSDYLLVAGQKEDTFSLRGDQTFPQEKQRTGMIMVVGRSCAPNWALMLFKVLGSC